MIRISILLAISITVGLSGCTLHKLQELPNDQKLTADILAQTKDEDLEEEISGNIMSLLGDDGLYNYETVRLLTPAQRAFYVTWILEGEVNNGGFNQFYYNSSGQLAGFGVEAFEAIKAPKMASLVKEAETTYAGIKDELEKSNDGTLESFSESYKNNPLNALDDRFFKLYNEEPIGMLRTKFVRKNINQFVSE